ncbi:hypothetical protein Salmuc_03240 [Salipiger mucosus DSM 16094]|uniref:Uncharacterized protein n=1 Tax=Salipiger mucosus DSM 16094 TaxID=1123237 RepID=S9QEA7_9RHOB|nr:hypothetical protein Salmuc_03240 [Salipiger mucosus DSM 16094]
MEATGAAHIVSGHGHVTTMTRARADTYDYLRDQSAFAYLEQFEALAGRNAQTAFQQMGWE